MKKEAVALIKADYPDRATGARRIFDGLVDYYRTQQPAVFAKRQADIEKAAEAVRDAWLRNVFPAMRVTWGTHPNNIGHNDFPGCFRCHDDEHKSADGTTITQDCSACHAILAMEEKNPKVLQDLGLE